MDDSGLDAARPRRRNWWELDQEEDGQSPYPPIGLEGFKPEPPPAIGFNVVAPSVDPMGDFARSWLPPDTTGTASLEDGSASPASRSDGPDSWTKAFEIGAFAKTGTHAARALAGEASAAVEAAAPEIAAAAGRVLPFAAGLPIAAGIATALFPKAPESQSIKVGRDLRLNRPAGQDTVDFERARDQGIFGTGLLRSWVPVEKGSVDAEVFERPQLAPDRLKSTFGERGGQKAIEAITAARPTSEEIAKERERALKGATEAERERMRACWKIQERLEELGNSSQIYQDGKKAEFGISVHPDLSDPSAGLDRTTDNVRHRNGMIGEQRLANEVATVLPNDKMVHFVNVPGWHGPDVLTIGPDENFMGWDAKSREEPTYISERMAQRPDLKASILKEHIDRQVKAGNLDPELAQRAWKNFVAGNYNLCTAPANKAFGSWVELRRGNKTIVKSR